MKVLIVIPALGPIYGGPTKIALELAEALSQRSTVDIDIVTTNANGIENLDVPLNQWVSNSSYRIQYFSHWGLGDYKISFSLTGWLVQNIKNYDIVHTIALFSYPTSVTHLMCRLYKIPYIINPQGMLEPWALAYKAWKKRFYYIFFEKAALQNASFLHMLSSSEAQRIEPLGLKVPTIILPNGIHQQDFEVLPSVEIFFREFPHTRNKTNILFLGRIDPKKGLDLLAPAFAVIHHQFPNTHLIVAGQDNIGFLPTAKEYFDKTHCLDAVTFTGMLTGEVKHSALAVADLYVSPSYSEGFSMSVLEGMAAGIPCVITTECNFPEAATCHAAYVVPPVLEEIADALLDCLRNPEKAERMGQQARKLVFGQYTWEQVANQLIMQYEKTINSA